MAEGSILEHDMPEAAWYTDPENPRLQRYWSGKEWTHHVRHSDGFAPITQPTTIAPAQPTLPDLPFAPVGSAPTSYATVSPGPDTFAPSAFAQIGRGPADFAPAPTSAHSASSSYAFAEIASSAPAAQHRDIDERVAYVPMSTIHHSSPSTSQLWNLRSSSPVTAAVWIIALSPIVAVVSHYASLMISGAHLASSMWLYVATATIVVLFVAGVADAITLRSRELPHASPAWLLLSPVAYLGMRAFVLHREGFRNSSPFIVFMLALVASTAAEIYLVPNL